MWSQVSRELFLRGQQNSFKSGKNCRERWFNHVDPSINKHWSTEEDLIMLQEVLSNGRKWSKAIPLLHGSKSEHMIKNRFHSLLRKKQHEVDEEDEDKLVSLIIEGLREELEHEKAQKKEKEEKEEREKAQKGSLKVEEPAIRVTRSNSNNSFRSFKSRKESYEGLLNSQNIFGLGDNG